MTLRNIDFDLLIYLMTAITGVMIVFVLLMSIYYLAFWSVSAKKVEKVPHSDKYSKFAVLIAARNESQVISHIFESLSKQTYPREYFDVWVIVEKKDDPTIEIAKQFGFNYFVRDRLMDGRRTKGFALQECIDYLWKNEINYDAYMIFDADNILDKDYIEVMNDLRQTGVRVGLGYRNFTNANSNWLTIGSSIMFSYMNQVTSKGRSLLFHKATLMGTGYYVDDQIIKDAGGWIFTGMTEDIQLTSYCYYHDIYMRYYPVTNFYDEQSPDYKTVHKQHVRWLFGYFERRGFLRKAGVQHDHHPKRMQSFMIFEFKWGIAPFVIFNVVMMVAAIINIVFGAFAVFYSGVYQYAFLFSLAGFQLLLVYLSFALPAFITILRDSEKMALTKKNKVLGVLTYIFFFYDFVLAFLDGLIHPKKRTTWTKIKHTGEVTNTNIEK